VGLTALIPWLLFATACAFGPEPAGEGNPVIILDIDTLRADHLGCYGYGRDTSPNIDAFAAGAIRFANAMAQAPNTPPSQTSILTSLYPSTHGMITDHDRVPEEVTTLAEAYGAAGFRTVGFADGGYLSHHWNIHQGFRNYYNFDGVGLAVSGPKVLRWLRKKAPRSFFLFLHTYDVHSPYDPPEPFKSQFVDGLRPSTAGFGVDTEYLRSVQKKGWVGETYTLSPQDVEFMQARYDGGIRFVDDWLGKIFAELRRLDLYERSTIVLISDHGEEFQEHGSVLHEKLYRSVTHIPLIIKPAGWHKGKVFPQVVESIDLMPTLLQLSGIDLPPGIQGRSLLPLIEGKPAGPFRAFSESPFFGQRRAITLGQHHLILTQKDGVKELYAPGADPQELQDLAGSEAESLARLSSGLEAWQKMITAVGAYDAEGGELDAELKSQLRALGYLN
jgi:arylsulfatase A-like enzyme